MAFATMNASPPRTCRMRNAPPWKGKAQPHAKCSLLERESTAACEMPPPGKEIHSRMRNAPLERKSTAACEMPLLERKSTAACEMSPPGKGFTSK